MGPLENGMGGWSYYNPAAVTLVLDSRSPISHASPPGKVPATWSHRGPGEVVIIPSLRDAPCQRNCSDRGAVCVVLDPDMKIRECVCPDSGVVLDFRNAHCTQGKSLTMCHTMLTIKFISSREV